MAIIYRHTFAGNLKEIEIDQNDSRVRDGILEVTRIPGKKFLSLYVTDSFEQCSVGIELTEEETIALSESIAQMLAEAD